MLDSSIAHKIINQGLLQTLHEAAPTTDVAYPIVTEKKIKRLPDSFIVVTTAKTDNSKEYVRQLCSAYTLGDYKIKHYLQDLLDNSLVGKKTFVEEVMEYNGFLDDKIII